MKTAPVTFFSRVSDFAEVIIRNSTDSTERREALRVKELMEQEAHAKQSQAA